MAKVTIQIEGNPEEVRAAILVLASAGESSTTAEEDKPEDTSTSAWTQADVAKLWHSLKPKGRQILKELAHRPDGYPQRDLMKKLQWEANFIGGSLSTVGHNMKDFEGKPHPIIRDWTNGNLVYRMMPEFARMITAQE